MKYKLLLLAIGLFPLTVHLYSQPYYARHYQVENGLSNNAVICSILDKKGFLWFGTKDGLNRFDGYTFKVFRNDPGNKGSIGSNFIHCLYEDHHGIVWVGTENGLFRYDAMSESFREFDTTIKGTIRDIKMDRNENLWFITGFTLFQYNTVLKKNKAFPIEQYFEATSIDTTVGGTIWVSSTSGSLYRYNAGRNTFSSYDMFAHSPPAVSRWIEKIQCADTSILVGTSTQGAKIFHIPTATYKDVLTYNTDKTEIFVRNFVRTSPDEFWIATESGIFIYNTGTGQATNLGKKYNDPYSISDNAVYTFCKDNEGGIWTGTYFGGINYYPKQYTPFKKYFPKVSENSLSGNVVREIREDKYGNLWIGMEDAGLNKLNKATGKFTHFQPDGTPQSISYSNIHGLLASGDELWVGTFEHGLDVLNIKTGKVIRRYHVGPGQPALKSNFFYCIYQTKSGEIILGTTRGAYTFNRANNSLTDVEGLPDYWFTSILKNDQGVIWASTYGNGALYYDTKTKKLEVFRYNAGDSTSISSNRVNEIFEDSDHHLWFATEGGLCKYDKASNNFKRYDTKTGLPANFVISIQEDSQKNLWISTTKGLVSFNLPSGNVDIYTVDNGLLNDQFNFSSSYKDTDGKMYFGSARGLISFHPDEITKNTLIPPVYITGFQVYNQELPITKEGSPLQKSITYTKKITLPHDAATFSLDFAALSYTAPSMLEYAYKMEGLDKNWTFLKSNRKIYFTELSAGTYIFKVKASNSSGIWNRQETSLVIQILPPWWASWWAYGIYGLIGTIIVFVLIRNYHRKVEEKNHRKIELLEIAKEKEIFQAKIEFFTNVAHEIRTPLTLIKGPLEKVMKRSGDSMPELNNSLKIMERNTNRLINLTNQLLDFRQTEIKGFSLSFVRVNISELLEETWLNFKPLAEQNAISYVTTIPPKAIFAYVDQEAVNKIFYNLFSNAIKYAESRMEITLFPVKEEDNLFSIEIKNDGHLIPYEMREKVFLPFFRLKETEKQKGTGIGLALSRSLAELHKGVLELKEPVDDMNVFGLSLPLHQENEFDLYNNNGKVKKDLRSVTNKP